MSQGSNTDPNFLWHGNVKINTDTMGFNWKFHVAEKPEADAITSLGALTSLMKKMMPVNSEITYATVAKDNHAKDSRFSRAAIGVGAYGLDLTTPAGEDYNRPDDCLLIRFEHAGGSSVTRKLGPVPDSIIEGGAIAGTFPTDVTAAVVAAPAAWVTGDTYPVMVNKFMKAFMYYTHHLVSGHSPGGPYVYYGWTAAYVLRVGRKKGGRVLVS